MARNFSQPGFGSNSSNSMSNFGLNDGAMDLDQFLWNNYTNFGQNQVNGHGLIGSQLLFGNSSNQPHHQNDQRSQTRIGVGQLGLSQRIADASGRARASSPPPSAPRRVHRHGFIDYSPVQNQPGVSEVTITEVVRTRFFTATSTIDRLLAPNDITPAAQERSFQQRSLLLSSQLSQPPLTESETLDCIYDHKRSKNQSNLPNMSSPVSTNLMGHPFTQNNQPFHNESSISNTSWSAAAMSSQVNRPFAENEPFNQNLTQNQMAGFSDLAGHSRAKIDAIELDTVPMRASVSEIKYEPNPNHNQARCQALLEEYYRNQLLGLGVSSCTPTRASSNRMRVPRETRIETSDNDDEEESDDGRIHSLPGSKGGPYTCSKCKEVLPTSQFFAAHVSSAHYKHETYAEKKRRHAARFKNKKDLRLFQSSDGLTIVPNKSSNTTSQRKKAKRAIRSEAVEVQKKQEENSISGKGAVEDLLVDVMIKQEHE